MSTNEPNWFILSVVNEPKSNHEGKMLESIDYMSVYVGKWTKIFRAQNPEGKMLESDVM